MRLNIWTTRALLMFLLSLCLALSITLFSKGDPDLLEWEITASHPVAAAQSQNTIAQFQPIQIQGNKARGLLNFPLNFAKVAPPNYTPKYEFAWAHPVNYGERSIVDINGMPVHNQPIIVLHETVGSATSAINHFQTPHPNEKEQASYHTLIKRDGTVIYIVPPEKRAFGAGNSVFIGSNGVVEAVKTHPYLPPSVNNFAYHTSLETPPDGRNHKRRHSGYTEAQYQSLAWLIAQSRVPDQRITTHKAVDRSGARIDPRSFNVSKFFGLLHSYRRASLNKSQTFSANSSLLQH
ncbi:peptidoglycan recognition family protein [Chroococcidiopsis sp. CCMEE 29]|uniref:peptidoglycan recognition protein family protein n=1 Tax=Chroococcidiopsis sp. CCMEE 29 TaxID=155894 RepID=UPI002021331E|nr:peptidoglycan recognition family protein [Chroococcidiopsis sp. CCMEE 29]